MTSQPNGTLYIGVTNDIIKRVYQHKNNLVPGFTAKYKVHLLVYLEETNDISEAIAREKQLKHWHRDWKINLIKDYNPEWRDLYQDFNN